MHSINKRLLAFIIILIVVPALYSVLLFLRNGISSLFFVLTLNPLYYLAIYKIYSRINFKKLPEFKGRAVFRFLAKNEFVAVLLLVIIIPIVASTLTKDRSVQSFMSSAAERFDSDTELVDHFHGCHIPKLFSRYNPCTPVSNHEKGYGFISNGDNNYIIQARVADLKPFSVEKICEVTSFTGISNSLHNARRTGAKRQEVSRLQDLENLLDTCEDSRTLRGS